MAVSRTVSNKLTVAVVDPDSDWGKRPGTGDKEVQFPVAVHVAGSDKQSPSLSQNAERAWPRARSQIKINPVPKTARPPTLELGDSQIRAAIAVQVSNGAPLVAKRGYDGQLPG
jgi:hypothetical protein